MCMFCRLASLETDFAFFQYSAHTFICMYLFVCMVLVSRATSPNLLFLHFCRISFPFLPRSVLCARSFGICDSWNITIPIPEIWRIAMKKFWSIPITGFYLTIEATEMRCLSTQSNRIQRVWTGVRSRSPSWYNESVWNGSKYSFRAIARCQFRWVSVFIFFSHILSHSSHSPCNFIVQPMAWNLCTSLHYGLCGATKMSWNVIKFTRADLSSNCLCPILPYAGFSLHEICIIIISFVVFSSSAFGSSSAAFILLSIYSHRPFDAVNN